MNGVPSLASPIHQMGTMLSCSTAAAARLAHEPVAVEFVGREFRLHRLDRDLAPEFRVLGQVHRAHPAFADLLQHGVLADPLKPDGRRVRDIRVVAG